MRLTQVYNHQATLYVPTAKLDLVRSLLPDGRTEISGIGWWNGEFELVTIVQVFYHATEPPPFDVAIHTLLRSGENAVLSTINNTAFLWTA